MAKNKNGSKYGAPKIPQHRMTPTIAAPERIHSDVTLTESLDSASELFTSMGILLDIDMSHECLESIQARAQKEGEEVFASWLMQFSRMCEQMKTMKEKLTEEQEKATQQLQNYDEQAQQLSHQRQQFELEKQEFMLVCDKIEREKVSVSDARAKLTERERTMNEREMNAQFGFAEQNALAMRQLEDKQAQERNQHQEKIQALLNKTHQLAEDHHRATLELEVIKHSCTKAEADRIRTLDLRELEIEQRSSAVGREATKLKWLEDNLDEEREQIEKRVNDEMAQKLKQHANEVDRMREKLNKAYAENEQLKNEYLDFQDLKREIGDMSVADVLDKITSLQAENSSLIRVQQQSNVGELLREKEMLSKSKQDLEREFEALSVSLGDAQRELGSKRIAATELHSIELENRTLMHHKNVLELQIDELANRIEHLSNAQKTQTPFPAMSLMDSSAQYQAHMELESVGDLKQFATELQHRIAQAEENVSLYYPLEEIQILLGGLAMSQLHIFQGISGTGKTSLAKAFAKAMGGFCTDISVQAGWRDRDDLLGHYNAFERRFYEKDCLQALYQAQTTRWKDCCNVILLDEMNLSRPEQYFAEFLSALEKNNPKERLISLSETALPNAPEMLLEGRKIRVPGNVWFIGTANHDETTNELADKTHDRAHVMTLPKQDSQFKIVPMSPGHYSFSSLRKAFEAARMYYKEDVTELLRTLTGDHFTECLSREFNLGWGNRFEKQALDFIPVMQACGANTGVALDHLLSTRVMRSGKVTGRYNVSLDAVKELKGALESFWNRAKLAGEPTKSLELLTADIRRMEGRY